MILHKIGDGMAWVGETVPDVVWQFLGFLFLWCATAALWFFPLSGIVQGTSNENCNASVMVIFGSIVGVATSILTFMWFYALEESYAKNKVKKAEDAVLSRVESFREMRDKEEILGMDPFPLDDGMDRFLHELHPIEQKRESSSWLYHQSTYRNYSPNGEPLLPRRIRSKAYATLVKELTPHGD